jgi:alkylglycerol monooxygenase
MVEIGKFLFIFFKPKYVDKNYGGTLIIFDRMFGSFQEEEEEVNYGISTKIESWNPFWLQYHYWFDVYEASLKSNGILNKFDF